MLIWKERLKGQIFIWQRNWNRSNSFQNRSVLFPPLARIIFKCTILNLQIHTLVFLYQHIDDHQSLNVIQQGRWAGQIKQIKMG